MFYEAVQKNRYFNRDQKYSDIDWGRLPAIVDAFEKRIDDWYREPIRRLLQQTDGGHFAFTAMALNCLLIDTLSQYEYGLPESDGNKFKQFVRDRLPQYAGKLKVQIQYERYDRRAKRRVTKNHNTIEDVLWSGFRCGILHEAHVTLYGSVRPAGRRVSQLRKGHLTYSATGKECLSVIINPWRLFSDVEAAMGKYLKKLKNRDAKYDPLRSNFKIEFSDSFGVDIANATL